MLSTFHFLRPWWFVAIIPVLLLLWRHQNNKATDSNWEQVIDPALQPYLLSSKQQQGTNSTSAAIGRTLALCSFILTITALAGPVWKKQEQPVFRNSAALVIALDLSRSMDARDLSPSRLERVKLKILDLVQLRGDGQNAIVVYAARPFVLCPLTSDAETLALQMKALKTAMMPAQGSRPDRAIALAAHLLRKAGMPEGDILLVTDGIPKEHIARVEEQIKAIPDYRVSVLGVGTARGAPVPGGSAAAAGQRYHQEVVEKLRAMDKGNVKGGVNAAEEQKNGGFLLDDQGRIVIARLTEASLKAAARFGHGRYHRLTGNGSDIHYLLGGMSKTASKKQQDEKKMSVNRWYEQGIWLLIPVLPLLLILFRRGLLLAMVLLVAGAIIPVPGGITSAQAAELWLNRNQQAAQLMAAAEAAANNGSTDSAGIKQNAAKAAELFTDPQWKAAASYKAGQFDQALVNLQGDDPQTLYNRGNVLAKIGRLDEALAAWDEVLRQEPDNEDAKKNRDLVRQLKDQQRQQQRQNNGDRQNKNKEQQNGNRQDQQQSRGDSKDQQEGKEDTLDTAQQEHEQQNNQQATARQQGQKADRQDNTSMNEEGGTGQPVGQQEEQHSADKADKDQQQAVAAPKREQAKETKNEEQQAVTGQDDQDRQDEQVSTRQVQIDPRLQAIPDDPGGLWRRKFLFQYQRQFGKEQEETEQW
ncbi:MAG: hypothetical protein CSA31_02460 [Desulfobulbus propionicus]|nr:MAG: hypothetical protein CSA31_02460 [Desulfobulbus propionicus]